MKLEIFDLSTLKADVAVSLKSTLDIYYLKGARNILFAYVQAPRKIENNIENRTFRRAWQYAIAKETRQKITVDSANRTGVAISISMLFGDYRNRHIDIDNYSKTIIDAIAVGLWNSRFPQDMAEDYRYHSDDHLVQALYCEKHMIIGKNEGIFFSVESVHIPA